jgi:hypothetical protein
MSAIDRDNGAAAPNEATRTPCGGNVVTNDYGQSSPRSARSYPTPFDAWLK